MTIYLGENMVFRGHEEITPATVNKIGGVKPDGTTITVTNDGTISSVGNMPSKQYDSLTLGANGWTYTAPADGYLFLAKFATASQQYFDVWVEDGKDYKYGSTNTSINNNQQITVFLPMRKGAKASVYYNLGGTTGVASFIYASA